MVTEVEQSKEESQVETVEILKSLSVDETVEIIEVNRTKSYYFKLLLLISSLIALTVISYFYLKSFFLTGIVIVIFSFLLFNHLKVEDFVIDISPETFIVSKGDRKQPDVFNFEDNITCRLTFPLTLAIKDSKQEMDISLLTTVKKLKGQSATQIEELIAKAQKSPDIFYYHQGNELILYKPNLRFKLDITSITNILSIIGKNYKLTTDIEPSNPIITDLARQDQFQSTTTHGKDKTDIPDFSFVDQSNYFMTGAVLTDKSSSEKIVSSGRIGVNSNKEMVFVGRNMEYTFQPNEYSYSIFDRGHFLEGSSKVGGDRLMGHSFSMRVKTNTMTLDIEPYRSKELLEFFSILSGDPRFKRVKFNYWPMFFVITMALGFLIGLLLGNGLAFLGILIGAAIAFLFGNMYASIKVRNDNTTLNIYAVGKLSSIL